MKILSSPYFIRHASDCACSVTQSCPTLCNPMDCVAHQASLSMRFPRQKYWVGCHFLLQGIYPSLASPSSAGRFFTTEPPGKPIFYWTSQFNFVSLFLFQIKVWGLFPWENQQSSITLPATLCFSAPIHNISLFFLSVFCLFFSSWDFYFKNIIIYYTHLHLKIPPNLVKIGHSMGS